MLIDNLKNKSEYCLSQTVDRGERKRLVKKSTEVWRNCSDETAKEIWDTLQGLIQLALIRIKFLFEDLANASATGVDVRQAYSEGVQGVF